MLGQILLTFLTVLIGVNLVPSIANTAYGINNVRNSTGGFGNLVQNVTGASAAMVDLIPLFFILGIVLTVMSSSLSILNKLNF